MIPRRQAEAAADSNTGQILVKYWSNTRRDDRISDPSSLGGGAAAAAAADAEIAGGASLRLALPVIYTRFAPDLHLICTYFTPDLHLIYT